MRRVWIGTSGWVYKQWAGNFYPPGWPKKDEFGYYAQHFPTVEINATFYRLPSLKMVRGWRERSPDGFIFAVKGSRFLTHLKRLNDTGPGLRKYFRRLLPLAERTGPILWQLPPNVLKTPEMFARLDRFLGRLSRKFRHAVEFRHPSWMDEETFALLRKHRAANVWLSSLRMPVDYTVTSDFVYLRFHGRKDGAYHDYTDDELQPWAKQLATAARRRLPCYVYFNNDLNTRAPLNAEALMRLLGRQAVHAFARASSEGIPPIAPPRKEPERWPPWTKGKREADAKPPRRRAPRRSAATRRLPEKSSRGGSRRATPSPAPGGRRFAAAAFSPAVRRPTH
jgi:uncharacterized protein YecE (DUF72 family)